MTDADVVSFLRSSCIAPVRLALEMANLTDNEKIAVELCGIRGLTYDDAVEALQNRREVDTVKRWYRSARKKLCIAWGSMPWVMAILEYERSAQK